MNDANESESFRQNQVDEAIAEYFEAIDLKQPLNTTKWLDRYPEIRKELNDFLETERAVGATFLVDPHEVDSKLSDLENLSGHSNPVSAEIPGRRSSDREFIGPYRLKRLLGAGGMGRVYEAVDPSGNHVAVKLLSPKWRGSDETLKRFKQEGLIASAINHPRCVFVKATDDDAGQPYIVMELMTGRTLKDLSQESGQLPVTKAVQAVIDVLDGLEEAHSHGMIHRDIKPANCYLESNGRVKVGDFGLARSMTGDSELTRTGDFVGTPLFASPEQVKGQSVDVRTDIYSVCATLYYLLTGKAPFAGSSPTSVIARIVSEDPQPIRELNPQVPELLERIVMRGLQRNRQLRYQTVRELRQALEPFVGGRRSISTWGRRFAAYGLDSILIGAISGILFFSFVPKTAPPVIPFPFYVLLILPVIFYFLICEGWKDASLGKWLLRLHVVDLRTGEPASRWRLLLRTFIGLCLLGILTDMLIYGFLPTREAHIWLAVQYTAYDVSYTLILVPLLFGRRQLLLHDWLSGTMVVNRTMISSQQQLAGQAAEYQVPQLAATGYPGSFGDFLVTGLICSSDQYAVLAANDTQLDRNVWLHLRPASEPELPAARRQCARTTRLRWLTGGRDGRWRWDAFLADNGAPLKHWTVPESPLTWRETRGILSQLVEQMEQSGREGIEIPIQSLDQIWLDTRGQITFLDWSPHDARVANEEAAEFKPSQHDSLDSPSPDVGSVLLQATQRAVIRETARLALCGTSRPLSSPPSTVSAILPLHARNLLQLFVDDRPHSEPPLTTAVVLGLLEGNSQKPAESNLESRAIGLGVSIVTCSVIFILVASLSRLCNHLILSKLSDQIVTTAAAEWLLEHQDEEAQALISQKVKDFPSPDKLRIWLSDRDEMDRRASVDYSHRLESMGAYSRAIALNTNLTETPLSQLKDVRFFWEQDKLVAQHWTRDSVREPVDLNFLSKIVNAGTEISGIHLVRRGPYTAMFLTLFSPLCWVVWLGLTRGGIAMRVSGLCIVGSDGRPADWWMHFLRALVMASPILVLQTLIAWIDLFHGEFVWVSGVLYHAQMSLFILYAIFTIAFPRRAPQDWLLGTHIVPR